jgi:hypothetical protein
MTHSIVKWLAVMAATGLLALAAAPWSMATAIAAGPSGTGVLSVSPAHPDPSVASGNAYFDRTVERGGSWTDEVAVVNTNNTLIDAWVDSVDGLTSVRTGAVYGGRTLAVAGAGAWVTPSVASVSVAAHAQILVAFTVTVPPSASAGDHVAGIAFESKHGSAAAGITTVLRSVVAVQVRVPGPSDFLLRVYAATLSPVSTTGTSGLSLDMADVGGLLGKPTLDISLDGPAGYHRSMSLPLDTMLPGDRITDEILWPDALAPGDYTLSITEDGSGRHGSPFTASAQLTKALLPSAPVRGPDAPPLALTELPAWALVALGAAGAAILTFVALGVARIRRQHRLGTSHL